MDLRSELDFVKSYINHNVKNMSLGADDENAPKNVFLHVKSGLLAGTERQIEKANVLIGSDENADIILIDEGVEPLHVEISFSRDFLGLKTTIKCLAAPVRIPIYGALTIDETRTVRGSTNITVGSVIIVIEDRNKKTAAEKQDPKALAETIEPAESKEDQQEENKTLTLPDIQTPSLAKKSWFETPQTVLIVAAGVLTIFGLIFLIASNYLENEQTTASTRLAPLIQQIPAQDVANQLQSQIQNAGLGTQLSVALKPDETIEVTGQITEDNFQRWLQIVKWYDERPGLPTIVNLVEQAPGLNDLPKIKYVWFGDVNPYVILANGQRARIGDTLSNGWSVKSIDTTGIILSQTNRSIRITF